MAIRPKSDWLVVKYEKPPEKIGSIVLPETNSVRRASKGEVLAVGPGRWRGKRFIPTMVKPGERIAFFTANLETKQGKAIVNAVQDLGDNVGMLREEDILFVIPPGVEVDVA